MAELKISPVSPDLIQDLKARYGADRLRLVEVELDEDKTVAFIVRKPGRAVLEAMASYGKDKLTESNRILISNCVLAGDQEALDNDGDVYAAVLEELGRLMAKKKRTIKKL